MSSTEGLNTVSTVSMRSTEGLNTASTGSMSSERTASAGVSSESNPKCLEYRVSAVHYPKILRVLAEYILPKYCLYSKYSSCSPRK